MPDPTNPHDISDVILFGVYGRRDIPAVRALLGMPPVRNAPSASQPRAPSGIATVDAFIASLPDSPEVVRRASIETLAPGEVALAIDVIEMALEHAKSTVDTETRREARAWLLNHGSPLYSARVCFEALGGDYEAICEELVKQWASQR